MERKGNKRSSSGDFSEGSVPQTWEERRIVSASELLENLNQIPQRRPKAQRELTGSEFLEFLKRQEPFGPEGADRVGVPGIPQEARARAMPEFEGGQFGSRQHRKTEETKLSERGNRYITSSVDYGSRDFYCPWTNSADVPYTPKENEMDDLYKNCADTRGNWWQGTSESAAGDSLLLIPEVESASMFG